MTRMIRLDTLYRVLRAPRRLTGKESACQRRRLKFDPESGRSLGRGHGNPLQYSCLENSMAREAWWAAVYGAAKSWTRLSINDHRVLSKNFSTVPSFLGFNLYQSLYTWTLKSQTVSWGLLQNQWFSGWLYRCLQSRSGTHSKFIHSTASTVHLLFVRCWGYNTE